ncbi:hypothetical protein H072_1184 [Dactylellina haptotyla CBS 200.50]|uniref:Uncharacterized protein n=1 Tax=Dactylellina haptotyla (strain CBS 200.50) TaxID=1284197 RepID=S8AV40_DACHA|nr:hypothetical protein H072_1184 [Dactylellina haptotyla CBS 200.50]
MEMPSPPRPPLPDLDEQWQQQQQQQKHHDSNFAQPVGDGLSGAYQQILIATALLTLPMLALCGLLLGLVFKYRVTGSSLVIVEGDSEVGAYLVRISASSFTTIASWSSSIAPLLPGLIMALMFFSIASSIRTSSTTGDVTKLPTPYQLNLLVIMATGRPGAIWEWGKYMVWKRRQTTTKVVRLSAALLVLSTLLGYLIWAADTWLHIATTTVLLDQTTPSTSPVASYGRKLSASCTQPAESMYSSCNLSAAASRTYLIGGSESLKTISNQSADNQIFTVGMSEGVFSFITGKDLPPEIAFSATTFASNVSCKPISRRCNLRDLSGASTPFRCTDSFYGDLTQGTVGSEIKLSLVREFFVADFFFDERLTQPITVFDNGSNPFYFALGTIININDYTGGLGGNLQDDPDIVNPTHGGDAILISCQVELYEMEYKYSNTSVTWASFSPANNTVTSLFLAPLIATDFGDLYVKTGITTAGISNTSQQIADKFAVSFSQITLAATTGVLEPQENLEEQLRVQFLVARVPIAPLYTLVSANALYALLGLLIAIFALRSDPKLNNNVRERLSVLGLVANLFEFKKGKDYATQSRDLFDESQTIGTSASLRVGMLANDRSGWGYVVWGGQS